MEENHDFLRQNGRVIFLNRDVELLPTDGRPLSAGGIEKLKAMYEKRLPMYRKVCDTEVRVTAESTVKTTAKKITEMI